MTSAMLAQALKAAGVQVQRLEIDSRNIRPGDTFVAYPGEHHDGRQYIAAALQKGAASVIWERQGFEWPASFQVPNLGIDHLADQAGTLAGAVYGDPSAGLLSIGITGTNGKTSCSQWLGQALTDAGTRCAVIGTLGNGFPPQLAPTLNTTPEPISLMGLVQQYRNAGAQALAMEVSSHALALGRVDGLHYDIAVLTNLTRDHLDFHGSMEAYAAAKARLFAWPGLKHAVLNADDAFGQQLLRGAYPVQAARLSYGLTAAADIRGSDLRLGLNGLMMRVDTPWGPAQLDSHVLGRFNASNLLAVLATLLAAGWSLDIAVAAVGRLQPVAGRLQKLGGNGQPLVVIDYAHTPDALEKALQTLREMLPAGGRLACVFGCGGERDRGKRPIMGAIASRLADRVYVTQDNPRYEAPEAIFRDIAPGLGANAQHIEARDAAIRQAIAGAAAGDIILLAGKGHEHYQEVAGTRIPFSDLETARAALAAQGQ